MAQSRPRNSSIYSSSKRGQSVRKSYVGSTSDRNTSVHVKSKSIRPKKIIEFPYSIDMNLISDEDMKEAKEKLYFNGSNKQGYEDYESSFVSSRASSKRR